MQTLLTPAIFITLFAFTIFWLISLYLKDASIIDYYWGPGFVVITWLTAWQTLPSGNLPLAFLGLISLWGLRLGVHMVQRHKAIGHEDARYQRLRQDWQPRFWLQSGIKIFLLQAVLQLLISTTLILPFVIQNIVSQTISVLGLCIGALGLGIEVISDRELKAYKALSKDQRPPILRTGLWSMSRHPNYLGEMLIWAGFGLTAFGLTGSAFAFVGPIIMWFLLIKVSGVPMTEQSMQNRLGFSEYQNDVPKLFPRLFRKA